MTAHILIVEDEPHNQNLLRVMLAPEGYRIETAASGEEAMARLEKELPDLILLDILLPGKNGVEVASEIKTNPRSQNIPVIMITALDDREARLHALNAGAEDFLTKPMDQAELLVRVRNLLRLKAYGSELAAALAEAREARLRAEHANSAKTLFLRSMSHELRTPLNAIGGYTDLLALGIRGPVTSEQAIDLGRIARAATYLTRLINDVLTVARLEGARPLELIAIDVGPLLAEVEGLCALQASAKAITLQTAPSDADVAVTADAERFQQILLNLVTNAIKFTSKGGRIDVTPDSDDRMVRIRVRDTGIGVRPADLDRVFEPFVQIDPQLTLTAQQGIGLGLSISRELARAMDGDLTLESAEGVGSTFTLTLPRAPRPGLDAAHGQTMASAGAS